MEYLTFGRALQRCRVAQLPKLTGACRALVLGDGDGRFTSALLQAVPRLRVVAVDSSPAMLQLLVRRAQRCGSDDRVVPLAGEAVASVQSAAFLAYATGDPFHLVASHFFLDCLSTAEVNRLALAVRPCLAKDALWVVSEFAAPTAWARLLVATLYLLFRLLTGLQVRQLPAWRQALTNAGFSLVYEEHSLRGLLTSSTWQLTGTPANLPGLLASPFQPRKG